MDEIGAQCQSLPTGNIDFIDFIDFIKNGTISPRYLQKLRRVIFQ